MLAWTAARTAPSTSGASLTRPGPVRRVELSRASSRLSAALPEVEQHEHAVRRLARAIGPQRRRDPRCARPEPTVLGPAGDPDRDVVTGDLGDHVAQSVGQRRRCAEIRTRPTNRRLLSKPAMPVDRRRSLRRPTRQDASKDASAGAMKWRSGDDAGHDRCRAGSTPPTLGRPPSRPRDERAVAIDQRHAPSTDPPRRPTVDAARVACRARPLRKHRRSPRRVR